MELERLWAVLRKWWWFMLLATAVAAVSGFLAVSQQPPIYQTRTTLMIGNVIEQSTPTASAFSLTEQLAALYADIANRRTVRDQTKEVLGLEGLPNYFARPVPNSPFIEIIVTASNPVVAQAVANELANQLILQSPTAPKPEEQEREAFVESQLNDLQANIEETELEIAAKQSELEKAFSAVEIAALETEVSALQAKLRTLRTNYGDLLSSTQGGALNTLTVIDPAALPTTPIGPNSMVTILTVSAVGFVLAFATAYLLEFLDDTIQKPSDIKWVSNLPVLPGIGKYEVSEGLRPLITLTDPRSPAAENYRALRTTVKAAMQENQFQTLLVTSSKPGEGKSLTSANLAITMAQQGHKVLLIDADLRRPSQHKLFNLGKEPGLADLLQVLYINDQIKDPEAMLKGLVQRTPERRLVLLTCGDVQPAAFELLSSDIMHKMLTLLEQRFDYIILDTPPILAVSDATALSTQVDCVLVIGDAGRVRRKELKNTIGRLQEANATILGLTINRLKTQSGSYYYNYYHEYMNEDDNEGADKTDVVVDSNKKTGDWKRRWTSQTQVDG
jgi:capsular exopolysaccharide synthesis family protein